MVSSIATYISKPSPKNGRENLQILTDKFLMEEKIPIKNMRIKREKTKKKIRKKIGKK